MLNRLGTKTKGPLNHLLVWMTLFISISLLFSFRMDWSIVLQRAFFLTIAYCLLAYTNIYWLMPNFLQKKKYRQYFMGALLLLALAYGYFCLLHQYVVQLPPRDFHFPKGTERATLFRPRHYILSFGDLIIGVLVFITSSAIKSAQIAQKKEKETADLKNEKLNTELLFLRSQINPHFLFNSLNNIYTLSLIKSDKTSKMIIMLSDMLRFMLYDCKQNKVTILQEVTYLRNYIALSILKDKGIQNIQTKFLIENEHLMIEPMLLIPFLENSFKHCKIEDLENGWIRLKLTARGNHVNFELANSIPQNEFTKDNEGGIGIENVRRRLGLLYKDAHELTIKSTESMFTVKLDLIA